MKKMTITAIVAFALAFPFFQVAGCEKTEVTTVTIGERLWGPWNSAGPFTFRCFEKCSISVVLQHDSALFNITDELDFKPCVAEIVPKPESTRPKGVVLRFINPPYVKELFTRTDALILYVHPSESRNTICIKNGTHHILNPDDPNSIRLTIDDEGKMCAALPETLFTDTPITLRVSWIP